MSRISSTVTVNNKNYAVNVNTNKVVANRVAWDEFYRGNLSLLPNYAVYPIKIKRKIVLFIKYVSKSKKVKASKLVGDLQFDNVDQISILCRLSNLGRNLQQLLALDDSLLNNGAMQRFRMYSKLEQTFLMMINVANKTGLLLNKTTFTGAAIQIELQLRQQANDANIKYPLSAFECSDSWIGFFLHIINYHTVQQVEMMLQWK